MSDQKDVQAAAERLLSVQKWGPFGDDLETVARAALAAAEREPDSKDEEIKELRSLVAELAMPNDNGYTTCQSCRGFWHTGARPVHSGAGCRVAVALAAREERG